jgi:hypothetical protein
MSMKRIALGLGVGCALLAASGCKKEPSDAASSNAGQAAQPQTVAQIRWLGMDRLASETNATRFLAIWQEPESRKLLSQTLDKLAAWIAGRQPAMTNPPASPAPNAKPAPLSAPLRPVLDDVVQAESYLEVRQVANGPGDLLLAVRLNPERSALWETNLAAAVEASTGTRPGIRPGTYGWQAELRGTDAAGLGGKDRPRFLRLARSGDWTLLSLAQDSKPTPLPTPFPPPTAGTNFWLQGDVDLARVAQALALDWKLPPNMPRLECSAIGDGENVISRGDATFAQPLNLRLEPWQMPTNLIQGQLISLTAARGLAPWLGKLNLFSNLPPVNQPDQLYIWGRHGLPFHTFYALSLSNATEALNLLAGPITNWANPRILPKNGSISLDTASNLLTWYNLPHAHPFLEAVTNGTPQFLYGGFDPGLRPLPMPPELAAHVLEASNLVYFNWELAGPMLVHWRYLDDVYRIVFDNQGPRLSGTASLQWCATNITNLFHAVTEVRLEQPNHLSFVRKSTVGLNSLELDALLNWLEMPQFPRGLGHLMDTNPAPPFIARRIHHPAQPPPAPPH